MTLINPFLPSPTLTSRPKAKIGLGPLLNALSALAHGWRAYVRYKRLACLGDRALATKGLRRCDIGRHAFFGSDEGR